ncbi:MAG: ABC transporter ATP-binding protein [Lachnospiraceae bacterium]|nr:ABC transporter ATP-binding protein [Lachnospiraceae bacterium]
MENDRKEIGILKAVGISGEDIFYLYFTKFLALSGLGAAAGLIAALLAEAKISVHIQELYGMSESRLAGILAAFAGAALTEGILLFSVRRTLKRMERLSAVEALTGQQRIGKEKKGQIFSPQYLIVASFTVNAGEMVAVMGPSGSGKSTLLYQVSGMDRADSGEVWINGTEICSLSEDEKAKLRLERMGFVFQQMNMLKNLNLIDNIMVPACHLKKGRRYREEITFRAHALMKKMGIGELAQRKITEVSGGQLQRACICRSLMNRPEILFADEPTGALNQKAAREVMEEFIRLNQEGVTILMVTHDSKVAAGCSRILYLLDGSIKGELHLAGLPERKKREEKVSRWLEAMGW